MEGLVTILYPQGIVRIAWLFSPLWLMNVHWKLELTFIEDAGYFGYDKDKMTYFSSVGPTFVSILISLHRLWPLQVLLEWQVMSVTTLSNDSIQPVKSAVDMSLLHLVLVIDDLEHCQSIRWEYRRCSWILPCSLKTYDIGLQVYRVVSVVTIIMGMTCMVVHYHHLIHCI